MLILPAIIYLSLVLMVKFSNEKKLTLEDLLFNQTYQCSSKSETLNEAIKRQESFEWSDTLSDWTLATNHSRWIGSRAQCIWPNECSGDRIVDQLILGWHGLNRIKSNASSILKIYPPDYSYLTGRRLFMEECVVNTCSITYDIDAADALIFQNADVVREPSLARRKDQIWIAYLLESPPHTFDLRYERAFRGLPRHLFNWTASYRSDSDLVTPYSKFVPYQDRLNQHRSITGHDHRRASNRSEMQQFYKQSDRHKSLIKNKSRKVAWFASNCNAANKRLQYARELSRYIEVDIFGKCGNFTCDKRNESDCLKKLNDNYKFYLAFENSNCREYVTEKLFKNALGYNDIDHLLLPIVMGAPREDYVRLAPPNSFIHVDDFDSPKELAEYLHLLDQDDALYYSYFTWKKIGQFIDTKFMCRVCAMLHESRRSGKTKSYQNLKKWWWTDNKGENACRFG